MARDNKGKFAKVECNCKLYEGQSWDCPEHEHVMECQVCHAINCSRKMPGVFLEPLEEWVCMFGHGYGVNIETREYFMLH